MRILLIYPDHLPGVSDYKGYFYQGLASIAAVLLKEGHDTRLLHQTSSPCFDGYAKTLHSFQPDIIGISTTSNLFPMAHQFAKWSRTLAPQALILCGGIHATLNAEQIIKLPEFDLVCEGEGEFALAHLARAVETGAPWEETPGMWRRTHDGSLRRNPAPAPIIDLDTLPWPNRDLWNYPNLQMESRGFATVMLSRGCHQHCTYCCNEAIAKVYRRDNAKHPYFRQRSVTSSIAELKALCDRYPFIKAFNFDDDNFFINLPWAREFTARYPTEIGLPFTCNLFPKLINEERVDLLARAGCLDLRIGLESGNERIRKEILGRNISDEDMRRAYRLCREAGIRTRSFVMVGIPGESTKEILDTIKFVAHERIGIAQYSIYSPFEKTALHKHCLENGYLKSEFRADKDYYSGSILSLPNLTKKQILMFRRYFPVLVTIYRLSQNLPDTIQRVCMTLLDNIFSWRWLPHALNPLSGGLKIVKHLIPARLNRNRIHLKKSTSVRPATAPSP